MNTADLILEFEELSSRANTINRQNKSRRFYPMTQFSQGNITSVGMYDYETKKYTLTNVKSIHMPRTLNEIRAMLNKA